MTTDKLLPILFFIGCSVDRRNHFLRSRPNHRLTNRVRLPQPDLRHARGNRPQERTNGNRGGVLPRALLRCGAL